MFFYIFPLISIEINAATQKNNRLTQPNSQHTHIHAHTYTEKLIREKRQKRERVKKRKNKQTNKKYNTKNKKFKSFPLLPPSLFFSCNTVTTHL